MTLLQELGVRRTGTHEQHADSVIWLNKGLCVSADASWGSILEGNFFSGWTTCSSTDYSTRVPKLAWQCRRNMTNQSTPKSSLNKQFYSLVCKKEIPRCYTTRRFVIVFTKAWNSTYTRHLNAVHTATSRGVQSMLRLLSYGILRRVVW